MSDNEKNNTDADQTSFDILVSALIDSIMHDEVLNLNADDRAFLIDDVLNVLEFYLDEEGVDMLNIAFEKFEAEYETQIKVNDILKDFEWHKNDIDE